MDEKLSLSEMTAKQQCQNTDATNGRCTLYASFELFTPTRAGYEVLGYACETHADNMVAEGADHKYTVVAIPTFAKEKSDA